MDRVEYFDANAKVIDELVMNNAFVHLEQQDDESMMLSLTPVECERLQGFPDNWTKYGVFNGQVKEISDTQRYKCIGNAVSVPIVKLVMRRLLRRAVLSNRGFEG